MSGETIVNVGKVCKEPECSAPAMKRGMCNRHYLRWWKTTPREKRPPTSRDLTDRERFEEKVSKTGHSGCWLWIGSRRDSGHGVAVVEGKQVPAAAAALIFAGVDRLSPRAMALHRCDRPECVNPRHLYWGNHQDNADDAWARGRHRVAEERPGATLTNEQVVEIRERYAAGEPGPDLATEFGIARPSLYQITSGNKWKSVGGPITRRKSRGGKHGE